MSGTTTLIFKAPNEPLSENKSRTIHWATRKRRLDPWKEAAFVAMRNALLATHDHKPVPVVIQVILPFRTAQRRDPHNYTGTNVKAIVDGLRLAGLVPDDNARWVTVSDPRESIQRDRGTPLVVRVIITPRGRTA